jgi:hypothetical protein
LYCYEEPRVLGPLRLTRNRCQTESHFVPPSSLILYPPQHYYLVEGDFTGSWQHVPKDLVMAVWGGEPREKSLRFFAGQGFPMLVPRSFQTRNFL